MANAWIIRPYPHHIDRSKEFLEKGIVAVGWPSIGDLTGIGRDEIETRIRQEYPKFDESRVKYSIATLLRFRDEMEDGDLVVMVPRTSDSDLVAIGRVQGNCFFEPLCDGTYFGYPHQRRVQWLAREVPRTNLPEASQRSMRAMGTLHRTNLDAIEAFVRDRLR